MDKRLLFLALVIANCCFAFLGSYLLLNDTIFFNSLAEQLSYEQIQAAIVSSKKWEWLGFVIMPLVLLIKLVLVAVCLSIGVFFANGRFMFKSLFGAALVAEFIFLAPALLKILWFVFIKTDYTLQDLQWFTPLSALNLFEKDSVQPWLVYPLQLLNVFEVIYWGVLVRAVSSVVSEPQPSESSYVNWGGTVMASYGTGLVLWVVVVMFLSVSYG